MLCLEGAGQKNSDVAVGENGVEYVRIKGRLQVKLPILKSNTIEQAHVAMHAKQLELPTTLQVNRDVVEKQKRLIVEFWW